MSFLFPLYFAAGLAVGLPILFHLIRRTPKQRQIFSSTMFLSPSPPRITKRSRIEDWLLLLLRGLALLLIACAFARPFLRAQEHQAGDSGKGTRFVVLLDVSASMRRSLCREGARRRLTEFLAATSADDAVELRGFDAESREILSFSEWESVPPGARAALALDRFDAMPPTWLPTELGRAMIEGAERLHEQADDRFIRRELVVISDFAAGSRWMPLQSFSWPEDVVMRPLPVLDEPDSNAALHAVASTDVSDQRLRIRVTNSPDATNETFLLGWLNREEASPDLASGAANAESLQGTVSVSVPAGQSRVVAAPLPGPETPAERLYLFGDEVPFDNLHYSIPRLRRTVRLGFIADPDLGHEDDALRGFLGPMFPDTPARSVTVVEPPTEENDESESGFDFAIIAGRLSEEQATRMSNWIRSGGTALFVARNREQAEDFSRLLGTAVPVDEPEITGYRMIGRVDLKHPVLNPFDDPRYADFTKVRIWHHRRFDLGGLDPSPVRLMSFEDGSPALAEFTVGSGKLFLLAASWSRRDGELAVWSKFIPIMNGLLDYSLAGNQTDRTITVGDAVDHAELGLDEGEVLVSLPAESQGLAPSDNTSPEQAATTSVLAPGGKFSFSTPGIYEFRPTDAEANGSVEPIRIAANLAPDESRTEPLDFDLLQEAGVQMTAPELPAVTRPVDPETARQLLNRELESKQQWWRLLLLVALGVLLTETLLSALLTRLRGTPLPA